MHADPLRKDTAHPVRALFVQSYTGLGGAETALANLLRYLPRPRVAPEVVSLEHGNGELLKTLEDNGIQVTRRPAGRFRQLGRTVGVTRWLAQKIVAEQFDVVVSNGGHPNLYARPAALWARRPTVWWVHDLSFSEPLRAGPLGFVQSLVRADVLVANSEHTARALRSHFPGSQVAVIRPGINLERVEQAGLRRAAVRRSLGIQEHEWVIGMFGRLQRWKGQHVFLAAADLLRKAGFPGWFWVVGGPTPWLDADYSKELLQLAEQLGIAGCVRFWGAREDACELMAACDAIVHASIRPEPYGLVVAEAMALGRPVVATSFGGPQEMIQPEQSGLLVAPENPAELAQALLRIRREPGFCAALGENAARYARCHFDARQTATQFCELLEALCPAERGAKAN